MMIRITKIFFGLTIAWIAIWLLPSIYDFFFTQPQGIPFTLYSTVVDDFVWIERDGNESIRKDTRGNIYSEAEYDSILPLFYYRQLIADERFPNSLKGIKLTPRSAQTEGFSFKSIPSTVNAPAIGLYPLLESMSGRVDLTMPDDVFRITSEGIFFIDMATNTVNKKKSKLFTDAMKKKGFQFPAQIIAGNPTVKKEYDEGYLITDNTGTLFHLKQTKSRPYCRRIELPENLKIKHIFPTEFRNRRYHAFLTDTQNKMHVLYTHSYDIRQVAIPSFNPECEAITIIGNLFDWTIVHNTIQESNIYAIDAKTLQCIATMQHTTEEPTSERLRKYVMPIRLSFTSPLDRYVVPRINEE